MGISVLGIDTSNYTTSLAVCTDGTVTENIKLPLQVPAGAVGLRQSDAVFAHTKNLPEAFDRLKTDLRGIAAVGYSSRPRNKDGSYMPCFLSGAACARAVSRSLCVPEYAFSHQEGHIRAAIYSSHMPFYKEFYAYHLSGGTFELLSVTAEDAGYKAEIRGGTKDVTAGQIIDRVGVMLGLGFPCGTELEKLAISNTEKITVVKTCVSDSYCNLSGLQNSAERLRNEGKSPAYISAYVIETVKRTIEKMTENALSEKRIPLLFSGGVASNTVLKDYFCKKYGAYFAEPAFSSDNAAGIALLAYERYLNEK